MLNVWIFVIINYLILRKLKIIIFSAPHTSAILITNYSVSTQHDKPSTVYTLYDNLCMFYSSLIFIFVLTLLTAFSGTEELVAWWYHLGLKLSPCIWFNFCLSYYPLKLAVNEFLLLVKRILMPSLQSYLNSEFLNWINCCYMETWAYLAIKDRAGIKRLISAYLLDTIR